jgi:biopolymer transport protein TolR
MSEINVTPFVDVVLVLLIIFMVAAPMMTVGVPVDLPRTNATPLPQEQEPLTITVDSQGRIFLQETEVPIENLVPQLQAIMRSQAPQGAGGQPERRIFVRGDRAISYGRVMEVMGIVSSAGFSRVALLAEQPPGGGAGRPPAQPPRPPAQPPRPPAQPGR